MLRQRVILDSSLANTAAIGSTDERLIDNMFAAYKWFLAEAEKPEHRALFEHPLYQGLLLRVATDGMASRVLIRED